ncbi:hypothetical protein LOTGIDRAFT_162229 [Lottia gigantea]|uniref:Uncharacterized protein n=1 Tax=Lottia gigantea TaxID=225164 RepID=V4AH81_LOTGI|nr:hypothetical protein LOTGIDRAFT_162229 [Lottia gigantea]ESO92751.1 hypothetical protein LOTGIDRAFT_162229 [Lottia gigantea]
MVFNMKLLSNHCSSGGGRMKDHTAAGLLCLLLYCGLCFSQDPTNGPTALPRPTGTANPASGNQAESRTINKTPLLVLNNYRPRVTSDILRFLADVQTRTLENAIVIQSELNALAFNRLPLVPQPRYSDQLGSRSKRDVSSATDTTSNTLPGQIPPIPGINPRFTAFGPKSPDDPSLKGLIPLQSLPPGSRPELPPTARTPPFTPGQPPRGQPLQVPPYQLERGPLGQPASGQRPKIQLGQPPRGEPPQFQPGQPPRGQPSQFQPSQSPRGQPPQFQPGQPPRSQPPQFQPGQPPRGQPPQFQPGQPPRGQPPQFQPGQSPRGQPSQFQPGQPPRGQPPQFQPGQSPRGQPPQFQPGQPPRRQPSRIQGQQPPSTNFGRRNPSRGNRVIPTPTWRLPVYNYPNRQTPFIRNTVGTRQSGNLAGGQTGSNPVPIATVAGEDEEDVPINRVLSNLSNYYRNGLNLTPTPRREPSYARSLSVLRSFVKGETYMDSGYIVENFYTYGDYELAKEHFRSLPNVNVTQLRTNRYTGFLGTIQDYRVTLCRECGIGGNYPLIEIVKLNEVYPGAIKRLLYVPGYYPDANRPFTKIPDSPTTLPL